MKKPGQRLDSSELYAWLGAFGGNDTGQAIYLLCIEYTLMVDICQP